MRKSFAPSIFADSLFCTQLVHHFLGQMESDIRSLGGCSGADGSKLPTIYTVGYCNNGTTNVACYWTDGKKTDLVSGSLGGLAASICVSNGTICIGGETGTGPCYWTNGVEHDLTPPQQTRHRGCGSMPRGCK